MTNLLQRGVTWLGGQLKSSCGVTITYTRRTQSVTLTATAENHEYQIVDEEGFATSVVSRDYILHAAELIIGGAVIRPRAGDLIAETVAGLACTFEVTPLSGVVRRTNAGLSEGEYEPMDTDGTLLRVHTKKIR